MKTLNFISGLGADERVFQYLDVPVPDKNFVKWIDPRKNESLENYAARLASPTSGMKKTFADEEERDGWLDIISWGLRNACLL